MKEYKVIIINERLARFTLSHSTFATAQQAYRDTSACREYPLVELWSISDQGSVFIKSKQED